MSERTCSVLEPDDCQKPEHSRGLCQMHYRRFMKHGSTDLLATGNKPGPKPDPTKPYSKHRPPKPRVHVPKTNCPQGHPYDDENTHVDARGYKHCRTCQLARMRTRRPATIGQGGHNAAKTQCPRGHPYDEVNTIYSKDGRRWCRTCARANGALQNIKRYGITQEDFDEFLESQNGCCMICGESFGEVTPHIDHDHTCCPRENACGNCVRGLLCGDCNKGLGFFRDNPERLLGAALYLERF